MLQVHARSAYRSFEQVERGSHQLGDLVECAMLPSPYSILMHDPESSARLIERATERQRFRGCIIHSKVIKISKIYCVDEMRWKILRVLNDLDKNILKAVRY